MINKSIKYIGVILLAYTLNACNEQRMNSSSETTGLPKSENVMSGN